MAATTTDRATLRRDGVQFTFPVAAATKIPAGVIVAINGSNVAVNGTATTGLKAVGVAEDMADNSAGAASAIVVKVRRGLHHFLNSAAADQIVLADAGADCFIIDNQTVAKTNGSGTRSAAGKVRDVDATGVWVEF